jgi:hypothetical protein
VACGLFDAVGRLRLLFCFLNRCFSFSSLPLLPPPSSLFLTKALSCLPHHKQTATPSSIDHCAQPTLTHTDRHRSPASTTSFIHASFIHTRRRIEKRDGTLPNEGEGATMPPKQVVDASMPPKDFIDFAFDLLGEEHLQSLDDPTLEAVTRAAAQSGEGQGASTNPPRPRPPKRQLVDADDEDGDEVDDDADDDDDDEEEEEEEAGEEAGPSSSKGAGAGAGGGARGKGKGASNKGAAGSAGGARPRKSARAAANKATREKARRDKINDR